ERRPVRHVPLVGDVAAGTDVLAQENIEELLPLPVDFTGEGELFMLRVRGDSMIEAGILDGDYVVCRSQPSADPGDVVVAGIPGDEATVKTFNRRDGKVVLEPANPRLEPMELDPDEVRIYGRVVTVLRRLWAGAPPPARPAGRCGWSTAPARTPVGPAPSRPAAQQVLEGAVHGLKR